MIVVDQIHMKPPTPQTKVALLPSAGYDYMRATKHKYLKTIESSFMVVRGENGQADKYEDVWLHIFSCEATGSERVWGYEVKMGPAIPLTRVN